ncbi:hypothetical protein BSLG_006006 [Batrachochytrium salamandrivorans]|nr:hypothetical protein BSLG_006006 [Batrachochytrium salamandrivorans]
MYIIRSRKALNAAISPASRSTHLDGVDPTKNLLQKMAQPVEPLDDCDAVRTMLILLQSRLVLEMAVILCSLLPMPIDLHTKGKNLRSKLAT